METKSIVIDIPDGMCIDESKSTFEKIVFKKKDTKPRSWEEYCHNFKGELFFENNNSIDSVVIKNGMSNIAKNYVPSEELAEAFLTMMQLMSLRQAWIGDWEAYPGAIAITRSCDNRIITWKDPERCLRLPLSFPTKEMATDFMNTFKDLLEVAKLLI